MSFRNSLIRCSRFCLIVAGIFLLTAGGPSSAQETVIKASFAAQNKEPIPVNVLSGQSCLVIFDEPIGRLAVSNTETAEAVVVAPNQMIVNGKASGRARFTAWGREGDRFVFFDVDVRSNLAQIDSQVRALFPKEDIRLSQANGSVVISGNVNAAVAKQVEAVVQSAGFKTVNLFTQPVQSIMQVQLQLRLAEVSRNKLNELAISPSSNTSPGRGGYVNTGGGPFTLNSVNNGTFAGAIANNLNLFVMSNGVLTAIRALQLQGALRALAEPNLVAMDGQEASFLAGGELPIPVTQGGNGNTVTIQYKEYGVRVTFKPTILDEQHIRLEIEPEVSSLDYANAVQLNGFLIPALRTRRAKTGIELRDGQTFGIAGLLDNNESKSLSKIPVIANVPVLGNLFKSKSFQKNESELVFMVTAKITEPLNPDAIPNMKNLDDLKGKSPLGVEKPGVQSSGTGALTPSGATSFVGGSPAPGTVFPASVVDGGASKEAGGAKITAPAGGEAKTDLNPAVDKTPAAEKTPDQKPAGEEKTTSPQKPAAAAPTPKLATKHPAAGADWSLRLPPSLTLSADRVAKKE